MLTPFTFQDIQRRVGDVTNATFQTDASPSTAFSDDDSDDFFKASVGGDDFFKTPTFANDAKTFEDDAISDVYKSAAILQGPMLQTFFATTENYGNILMN